MTRREEVRLDVTGSVPIDGPLSLAASVYCPDDLSLRDRPTVFVCTPGGSLSRTYYGLEVKGRSDYSFGGHLAAAGIVVVAMDHLGTGDSSRPVDGDEVTLRAMSAANAAAARSIRSQLATGELVPSLPPLAEVTMIGAGHSLGGFSTMIQQASASCYDAVCIMGASNAYIEHVYQRHERQDELSPDELRAWVRTVVGSHGNDVFGQPYMRVNRAFQRPMWFWADVPDDVVAADPETVLPRNAALDGMTPQFALRDAAAIDVPVLLAFAENDVSPDPHVEPTFYPRSGHITLFVLPRAAHIHNLAGSRLLLWDRIVGWAAGLRGSPRWAQREGV